MTTKLTIPANYIGALKLFCPKKQDLRECLKGIHLEILGMEARLVATDGYRLGIARVQDTGLTLTERMTATIPIDLLSNVKPNGSVTITLRQDQTITIEYAGMSTTGKAINKQYPDYRKVVPRNFSGEVAQFNADDLTAFAKAFHILNRKNSRQPTILHNGNGPALVDLGKKEFIGILMPMSYSTPPESSHDWVYEG